VAAFATATLGLAGAAGPGDVRGYNDQAIATPEFVAYPNARQTAARFSFLALTSVTVSPEFAGKRR
jgi:hypothetical protein